MASIDLRAAAQQALEALEAGPDVDPIFAGETADALRAALAEPGQEPKPVAWRFEARHIDSAWAAAVTLKHPGPEGIYMRNVMPLYAHPPQRKPLSEEEIHALRLSIPATTQWLYALVLYTRAVERAHGIGGEG